MGALPNDMKTARTEEAYNDVCLMGTDNKDGNDGIPASKLILAMRSQVFHIMFYGDFRESEALAIPLNYSSSVIRSIVDYCYTDRTTKSDDDEQHQAPSYSEADFRDMVSLRSAADFFDLPELREGMTDLLYSEMAKHPGMICAVLDELSAVGETDGEFHDTCLGIIRVMGEDALLPNDDDDDQPGRGVIACGNSVIGKVLAEEVVGYDHCLIARCLQKWEPSGRREDDEGRMDEGDIASKQYGEMRHAMIARGIAGRVRLNLIAPPKLARLNPCSLFSRDQLYEALKEHALSTEQEGGSILTKTSVKGQWCIVKGAGCLGANGMYSADGISYNDGVPIYEKKGMYMDKAAPFKLFRRANDIAGKGATWFLGVYPVESMSKTYLYRSPVDEVEKDKIPRHTWRLVNSPFVTNHAELVPAPVVLGAPA